LASLGEHVKQLDCCGDGLHGCYITLRIWFNGIGIENPVYDLLPVLLSRSPSITAWAGVDFHVSLGELGRDTEPVAAETQRP
jgi:hypothetical protein